MKKKSKTTTRTRSKRGRAVRRGKNKKLQAEGFRMPATFSLVVALGFGLGLFFLWFSSRTEALARQIQIEERELADVRRQVAGEEVRWNDLRGPRNLRAALQRHNLNMDVPRPDQIIHIRDMALWESTGGEMNVIGRMDREQGASTLQ